MHLLQGVLLLYQSYIPIKTQFIGHLHLEVLKEYRYQVNNIQLMLHTVLW